MLVELGAGCSSGATEGKAVPKGQESQKGALGRKRRR